MTIRQVSLWALVHALVQLRGGGGGVGKWHGGFSYRIISTGWIAFDEQPLHPVVTFNGRFCPAIPDKYR